MTRIYNELFSKDPSFQEILEGIGDKEMPIGCYGLAEPAIAPAVETIYQDQKRPVLLVTYDMARAKKLAEDLSYYAEDSVYLLQPRQLFFFQRDAGSNELLSARLRTMNAMIRGEAKFVVTTPEALGGIFLKPSYLKDASFSLKLGDVVETDDLMQKLLASGYRRVDFVEGMGQFSIRGGIIDIYTPDTYPYRVELFDVEVDSIRRFDPYTQRSVEDVDAAEIFPVHDVIFDEDLRDIMAAAVEKDLKKIKKLKEY